MPEPGDQIEVLPDYVRGLLNPDAYPHHVDRVELAQTHVSYVFLAGDRAYKTKKPVDFGFINQLSPEARDRNCRNEVRLNRRLAPSVYLGVAPVLRHTDGRYHVGSIDQPPLDPGEGEVVERAVVMRRLPEERTLHALLASGTEPANIVPRLVRRLIAFHEAAEVVPNDPAFAGAAGEAAWWAREHGEAAGFVGSTWRRTDYDRTVSFIEQTLRAQADLFDERLAAGRVVEGHGDLHTKHIYVLGDGDGAAALPIVDCIEFNDWFHFRYLDVGYEVAFLAMDLEANGRPELGDEFAGRYIAAACDETLGVLQPLHRAFRAFVRGKVESIGARAPEVPAAERDRLRLSAERYFALAATYADRRATPVIVVLAGLPATGKSTVAGTLAARTGAAYLSSDAVRKQLAGRHPRERATAEDHEGLYSEEMTARTYAELRRRAAAHLAAGRPVVLDAMHGRASERAAAAELAAAHGVPLVIAELRLSDEEARRRLEGREADPLRTSDATWAVYVARRADVEPISPAEGRHLILDATKPPGILARRIADALPHE